MLPVGKQQEYSLDNSIAPLVPPTAETSAAKSEANLNLNKRKASDLQDADESTSLTKKQRPETISTAHSAVSRTDLTEQAESNGVTAPGNEGLEPENAHISPPAQEYNHSNGSYDQPAPVPNLSEKYPSQEREPGTNQATTGDTTTCGPCPRPDTQGSSSIQAAETSHRQASREYSPLNVNPAQVVNLAQVVNPAHPAQVANPAHAAQVVNPAHAAQVVNAAHAAQVGLAQAYDSGPGREMSYNAYAQQWDPMSHQYAQSYPRGASDYRPHPEFFSHDIRGQLPPPPIPPRPGSNMSNPMYPPRPGPPVYPQTGYYHTGLPEQPSGYYAAMPGPPAASHPQTYTQPFYHPQMPGFYQQPQSGTGPPPMPDYSSLPQQSTQQDDRSHYGGHHIPAVQDGPKLENA